MPQPKRASRETGNWWLTGALVLAGLGLFYLAGEQLQAVTRVGSPTFEMPEIGYAVWLLLLIASGIVFGLAVLATQHRASRIKWISFAWISIPLALMVYFYLILVGVSLPGIPAQIRNYLFTPGTQTACALLAGFFFAGALAPLVLPSRRRH